MKEQFIIIFLTCFFSSLPISQYAQDASRIESEYKLEVPKAQAKEIWNYIVQQYGPNDIKQLDSSLTSSIATEVFYDQYFDNDDLSLFENQAGVRLRQRYVNDSLAKELVQLKLPLGDVEGIAREEIKFSKYKKVKKTDPQGRHPFWQFIRPKERDKVDLHLASYNLLGEDLEKKVMVKQVRNRVYISQNGEAFMTMTFDKVRSFYFPYSSFIELELELNELLYTDGDQNKRKYMEQMNKQLKEQLADQFPDLVQDQTPKYNKMSTLLNKNWMHHVYENLWYGIFAFIVGLGGFLFVKREINFG